jgi:hypothetical protein
MKRAVSVSLGSPSRDKRVVVNFKGQPVSVERIGTGGDAQKARALFAELDGKVDALAVGGMDLYVRLEGREYPIRSALKLVQDVRQTPVVDGRILKYVYERRVWERAQPLFGEIPRFRRAFMPFSIDRLGLAEAVESVCDELTLGDLMFALDIPIPIRGLQRFRKVAHLLMPIVRFLPLSMIAPPGTKGEPPKPKHERYWNEADLIVGDFHYIHRYSPFDLQGKCVITNTTTEENIAFLHSRGVRWVLTTTPRYEGRSFGVNLLEGALTAFAGKGRPLNDEELDHLIDELDLRPDLTRFEV